MKVIDFNGYEDSLFHEFGQQSRNPMSYIKNYGAFDELPFNDIKSRALELYSGIFTKTDKSLSGDFSKGAEYEFAN